MGNSESNFDCPSDTESKITECDTTIGYSKSFSFIFKIVSIIGFLSNAILMSNHFNKVKKGSGRKKSTMKKLLKILPVLGSLASVYWIISSFFFETAKEIKGNSTLCSILALSYTTILIFELTFINCLLIQFKKINYNPIDGILRPDNHILSYKIISLVLGLIFSALCYMSDLIGRSPMMTCFIYTDDDIGYKSLIFLIPIFCICFALYQIIRGLYYSKMFITDKGIRKLYKKNTDYILIVFIFYIPLIFLMILTIIRRKPILNNDTFLIAISFFSTTITALIPFLISIVRLCKGISKINCLSDYHKAKKKKKLEYTMKRRYTNCSNYNNSISNYNDNGELSITMMSDPFRWLEHHVMAFFMRDILLGISTCLNNSKKYGENIKINKKDYSEILEHKINSENYNLNDQTINTKDYINIQIMEYAPKCFAYLRNLENIDINLMIESFLPKNNKQSIKQSQGKSGTFFISTDDNKYMVKTLKAEEFELIKQTFLDNYLNYITNNSDSLLCRLYGMYDVILDGGDGDEILIIVMRNVIGDFKDNLVVKYDLKGSTYKRESELDINTLDKAVMKDNNFSLAEKAFFLNQDTINKLRVIIKKDSEFLCKLELMDYSLFVVKLTLSKNEIIDIFGDNIYDIQENEIMQINKILDINHIIKKQGIIKKESNFGSALTHDIIHYENYLFPALNKGTAYIFAIIDYFQTYNFYKFMEYEIKTRFKNKKQKKSISCVDPVTYSKRFINFFRDCTEVQKIMINDDEGDDKKSEKSRGGGDCNTERIIKKKRSKQETDEPDLDSCLKINGIEFLSSDDNNDDKENNDINPSSI